MKEYLDKVLESQVIHGNLMSYPQLELEQS